MRKNPQKIANRHNIELTWQSQQSNSYQPPNTTTTSTSISVHSHPQHASPPSSPVFYTPPPPASSAPKCCDLDIQVFSRKIKNNERSPSDVLFRTHTYEFQIKPKQEFFEWNGFKRSGFMLELKLMKQMNGETPPSYREYTYCDKPVIAYSFCEDIFDDCWHINLIWPPAQQQNTNWKGQFCFKISVFRKTDHDTCRRIITKQSSSFCIYSKPEVYLKQVKRNKTTTKLPTHSLPSSKLTTSTSISSSLSPTLSSSITSLSSPSSPSSPLLCRSERQNLNHQQNPLMTKNSEIVTSKKVQNEVMKRRVNPMVANGIERGHDRRNYKRQKSDDRNPSNAGNDISDMNLFSDDKIGSEYEKFDQSLVDLLTANPEEDSIADFNSGSGNMNTQGNHLLKNQSNQASEDRQRNEDVSSPTLFSDDISCTPPGQTANSPHSILNIVWPSPKMYHHANLSQQSTTSNSSVRLYQRHQKHHDTSGQHHQMASSPPPSQSLFPVNNFGTTNSNSGLLALNFSGDNDDHQSKPILSQESASGSQLPFLSQQSYQNVLCLIDENENQNCVSISLSSNSSTGGGSNNNQQVPSTTLSQQNASQDQQLNPFFSPLYGSDHNFCSQ